MASEAAYIDLKKHFPILAVEKDLIISKSADVTAAFMLELPEIFTMSEPEFDELHQAWIRAIRTLPKFSIIHKQDWFVEETFNHAHRPKESFLTTSSNNHFNGRKYLSHYCYLFLTKTTEDQAKRTSISSSLLKKHVVPKDMLEAHVLEEFLDTVNQFVRILEDTRLIKATRVTEKELLGDENGKSIFEKYLSLNMNPQEVNDIDLSDGFTVGNNHCDMFSFCDLDDLPLNIQSAVEYDKFSTDKTAFPVAFSFPLGLTLPYNHIYNQYIFIDDHQATMKYLEAEVRRLHSLSLYSRENEINKQWTEEFLNESISFGKMTVRFGANLLVWADSKDKLQEVRSKTSAAINRMNVTPRLVKHNTGTTFWAGIPGNAGELGKDATFLSFAEQVSCFLNLESNYQTSPSGLRLTDRLYGRPLEVDIFDEPMTKGITTNRNFMLIGPSGSGKSFFMNHMIRSYYEMGSHIVIVDTGNSYLGLSQLVGGYYFTYTEENPIAFNPFHVDDYNPDIEKVESLISLLITLWKKSDESLKQSEYVTISKAVSIYYQALKEVNAQGYAVEASFNTFYEFVATDFKQIQREEGVREKEFDLENFLYVLSPYYKGGKYDYLLNSDDNLDLINKPFIVFELDNIKDHPILFPVVTIIIMETFTAKMRKLHGIRKMMFIEEAWKAIAKEGMSEYIKYLYKTARKHFGTIGVITQELDDIMGNAIVKDSIVNNSEVKFLLDQKKYQNRFEEVQRLLGLSDKQKQLVLSVNLDLNPKLKYKEVFISWGGSVSKVYGTEVSLEEYAAYTTEQKEKVEVFGYAEQLGSLEAGLKAFADRRRKKN